MVKRNTIILIIRNDFIGAGHLTYLDKGWNTWFFPNFTDEGQSEEDLRSSIGKRFEVPSYEVAVEYQGEFSEVKPSEQHNNEPREYQYKIYCVDIGRKDFEKFPRFYWDGLDYKWETLKILMKDPQVKKNNRALVEFVLGLEEKRN